MKPDYSLALALLAATPHPSPAFSGFSEIPAWQRDPYQRRHGGCSTKQWSHNKWEKNCRKKKIAKASKKRNRK